MKQNLMAWTVRTNATQLVTLAGALERESEMAIAEVPGGHVIVITAATPDKIKHCQKQFDLALRLAGCNATPVTA